MTNHTAPRYAPLTISLGFDRRLVWERGNSVRYLIADVTAPPADDAAHVKPKGLNLALVIDASGSMQGMPLEAAKSAAIGVIQQLSGVDRLSVVTLASDVITHVSSRPVDDAGRAEAIMQISRLRTRGSTDLSSGWIAGAECVARDMESRQGCRNHVVLLSDGHANAGICDVIQLAQIASDLRERGLFTSTVGIGDGYSPVQLQAIAEAGGGRMHDAERPVEIIEVVLAELGEVQATVAQNVVLEVELPAGVHVEVLGTFPLELKAGVARCAIGALSGSGRRRAVLKVKTPAGKASEELLFSARLNWRQPGSEVQQTGRIHPATLRYAVGKENSAQGRDIPGSIEVARLWQSLIVRRAVEFNRDAAFERGAKYLATQLRYFEKYCRGLPGTEVLVEQLRITFQGFHRPWQERARKEMALAHYKSSNFQADSRSTPRESWVDFARNEPRPAR